MSTHTSPTRRTLIIAAKISLAVVILAYLVYQAQREDAFSRLVHEPKLWGFLVAGLVCSLVSVTLSFVRWHVLITALRLPCRLTEAIRLGSLGYMLNFVSLGSIGGDLFKAFFLAHGQPGRRTEAVATVIVDRLLGLLIMLVLASVGILAVGLIHSDVPALAILSRTILLATTIGIVVAGLLMLIPSLSGPRMSQWAVKLPIVGTTAAQLLGAVQTYQNQKRLVLLAGGICVVVDVLYITTFYFIARGLPVRAPTWSEHLIIVPVATMAGAIPATPNGVGELEAAVNVLYQAMPGSANIPDGDGTLVTFGFRLTTMVVAVVGFFFYLSHRAEVREVIVEAEEIGELA